MISANPKVAKTLFLFNWVDQMKGAKAVVETGTNSLASGLVGLRWSP